MEEVIDLQEFVGCKVRMEAKEMTFTSSRYGDRKYTQYVVADDDVTMHDLKLETAKRNLDTRVWLPNTMGTCDFRMDRLNVRIEKADDGEYSITKVYLG